MINLHTIADWLLAGDKYRGLAHLAVLSAVNGGEMRMHGPNTSLNTTSEKCHKSQQGYYNLVFGVGCRPKISEQSLV